MIYKILFGLVCATVLGGSVYYGNKTEYIQQAQTATSTPVVGEDVEQYPEDVLERAKKAQEDVLKRYELEQEKTRLRAESDVLEARIEEIDKELGVY